MDIKKLKKYFQFKNFFKKFLVVLVLVGVSMTNIPYAVLSEAIDSYVTARNIVDKAWHISKNGNIVDNFAPAFHNKNIDALYKLAGQLKVDEVSAAVNYVGGQSAGFAGKTAATTVTFSLTGGLASTPAAGDLVIIAYSVGSTANRALTIRNTSAVNYTLVGTELYQNDTYDSNLRVAYRFMPATPETQMVLSGTGSTADAGNYTIHVFRGVDPNTPLDVAAVTTGNINTRVVNPNPITPVTSGSWIYVAGAAAGATGGTYTAAYLTNFRAVTTADTNDSMIGAGYTTWSSGAYDPAAFSGGGTSTTNDSWTAITIALRPAPANTAPTLSISQPSGVTVAQNSSYNITYSLSDPEQAVTAAFYYDTDNTGLNGTAISGACATAAEGTGVTCSWNTSGVTPGTYYVYGITNDGIAAQVSAYSPGTITINAAPTLSISQPDGVGDNVTVGSAYNITYSLADSDNIQTAAFYYDTDNTGLNGTAISGACATAAEGAGVTCSWDTTGVTPGTYYVYGITNDGVNAQVSAYSGGTITISSPNSAPTLTIAQPDGTSDTIAQNTSYNITYTLADSDNTVTAAFYYDTDNTGLNGTAISGACAAAAEGAGVTCSWNTTGVTPGNYYVYGITNDGVNPAVSAYSSGMITINAAPTLSVSQPDGTGDTIAQNASFNITYTLADSDNVVTAAFYYDTDNTGLNGTAISGACATAAEGTGVTCSWSTTGITPGSYYVYAVVNDGINSAVSAYSSGMITINAAPTLSISQPDGVGDSIYVGQAYNITYTLADSDNVVTTAFYYDTDNTGLNGTAISGACATAAEGAGVTCSWDTTGVPAGTYYVYGVVNDGVNSAVSSYSPGTITLTLQVTLTVAATAGSQVTNLNSGDNIQYVHTTSCTNETTCAAVKLTAANGSVTVTSIKFTESGTVAANTDLSNAGVVYDTDANFSNGFTGVFGSSSVFAADQTITFTNAGVTIPQGSTYYFYIRFDMRSSTTNYPAGGQTIDFAVAAATDVGTTGSPVKSGSATLAGSTTVRPQITGYTNSTETALNYAASCTGCGARIGPDTTGFAHTIVINGYGFGSDPGSGNRDTASNKVEIGTKALTDNPGSSNVSAWSNTSITIKTDTAVDDDVSWGTNYGGASSLKVTAGGVAVPANLNFYVFPQVLSITGNTGYNNAAREYDPSDLDGVITLNGTRFGSASTGGYVRVLGCSATTCSSPTDSATTTSWSSTGITVQIPTVIANNSYTGSLVMQQGTGANSKTHTYTTGFRVLPRITNIAPTSGSVGDAVTVNGNHFCQNAGVCPGSFGASNKVTFFNAIDATAFTSWSDTAIATQVPVNSDTGNVTSTSNGYGSNGYFFTVLSPIPEDPTNLRQYKNEALTQQIVTGGVVSTSPVHFTMTMQVGITGGTLYPQIEYKPIGTPFTCSGTSVCASAVEGIAGKSGPGPVDCSSVANGCAVTSTMSDNLYHWQARVRHNKGGVDYYSNWVPYPTDVPNLESETDFKMDTTGPTISAGPTATQDTNSVTIVWSTSGEQSTSQVQYNTNGTFTDDCTVGNDCTTIDNTLTFNHSVTIQNLNSGVTYYYRVRSKDAAGNETRSNSGSFTTNSVTQPAKTVEYFIYGATGALSGSDTADFSVFVPEPSYSIKSAYVVVSGIAPAAGTTNITLGMNAEATQTFAIASGDASFKIYYKVNSLNIHPTTNQLTIITSANVNIASAKLIVTYAYTP